jgi:5-methylcytosine-specific restriction endonuclease McrA
VSWRDDLLNHRFCETCYLKRLARKRLGSAGLWVKIKRKFDMQGGRCSYTGTPLCFGVNDSLDHVRPISRYPELASDSENIEWVTRKVNEMKRDRTPDEFLCMIGEILKYRQPRTGPTDLKSNPALVREAVCFS